ncbi:unnamed protein product [Mytilus edulis]|uniref:DZIP3-like HEPN domain-containing protein n=1 Tax=Mytilus edulis TaxID=6550 RepID=A0A8S3RHY0_MYTED|nr:unnamed protein product [Mytilus edulis]
MASLSPTEENFVRLNLLLTGISPRAVRTLFDYEFAPVCLDATLKKEFNKLRDLQKKRVINQSQWNLLTPRFPDTVVSILFPQILRFQNFDVTLMSLLLRNLTTIAPPHGGYDNLPSSSETTPAADLARIKYYRNVLAHLNDGNIENAEFSAAWDDITGVSSI